MILAAALKRRQCLYYPLIYPMSDRIVVGMTGRAGSGKDTVANYLVQHHGFTKLAYAGPLKSAVCELFAIEPAVLEDRIMKEKIVEDWGRSPRWLAQWLGTDILREKIDENIFVKNMARRIGSHDRVVISDVRFSNEADLVHELGGEVWSLEAGERLKLSNHMGGEEKRHITEKGLGAELIDNILDTSGSWDKTSGEVDVYIDRILRKVV